MDAIVRRFVGLAAVIVLGAASPGFAHEAASQPNAPLQGAPAAAEPRAGTHASEPTIDPFMRALVIGIAASILREAAAQPEPLDALGNAVERRVASALANPHTLKLIESALHNAVQDAPVELREPLAQFASSVLHSLRRDLLEDGAARRPYY